MTQISFSYPTHPDEVSVIEAYFEEISGPVTSVYADYIDAIEKGFPFVRVDFSTDCTPQHVYVVESSNNATEPLTWKPYSYAGVKVKDKYMVLKLRKKN